MYNIIGPDLLISNLKFKINIFFKWDDGLISKIKVVVFVTMLSEFAFYN